MKPKMFNTILLTVTSLASVTGIIYLAIINNKNNKIMATQAELAQELRDIKTQNDKARAEVLAKIETLETALQNAGSTTPEVDEALADLKSSVQTDDDIVPDEADPTTEG